MGFTADVYLDDFYGAAPPEKAFNAFERLQILLDELGLKSSPEKDCSPSTSMVCLGIAVNTIELSLAVPPSRVEELSAELVLWKSRKHFTVKQLQSLLGKLSYVSACVKPGRIFMSRLLGKLRAFPSGSKRAAVTTDMKNDIDWWLEFLPVYNGVSIIKADEWDFAELHFATDASLQAGGATCMSDCCKFMFPPAIIQAAEHITALELFTIIVAVRTWAPMLEHKKFLVSCDNEAAVTVVNSGATRNPFMQRCLRQLWFTAALHDFEVRARHIPGEHNTFADCLSRWDSGPSYRKTFHEAARKVDIEFTFHEVSADCLQFQVQ
jgi:hypothetical protein